MPEYNFMDKIGRSPFAMIISEPRIVYDEWVWLFKGEEPVRKLLDKTTCPDYASVQDNNRDDNLKIWNTFHDGSGMS